MRKKMDMEPSTEIKFVPLLRGILHGNDDEIRKKYV
jgi:hypothetical protein